MKNNLLFEDIQKFKSIINYNPSYGLINESNIATLFKSVTGKLLKSSLDDFLKNTLRADLKSLGKRNITLVSKNTLTSDGQKLIDEILTKNGISKTFGSLDNIEKQAALRIANEAQQSIDKRIISKLGGNITRESVANAFVAMTKSKNLTKESIDELLKNLKTKDFFTTLKRGYKSKAVLDDISQSAFKKPFDALSDMEKNSLRRTINGMNRNKLSKELARQLIEKAPQQTSKLKKLWGGVKRLNKTKVLKWTAGLGLSAWAIYAIIKYWDDDVTIEDEDEKKIDDGGGGGGGNGGGGGGSTSYTQCSDFPYKKNCSSPIVAEVQKCLGLYNDGKFGPKTEAKLVEKGYGTEITKEVYDKIKEKCGTNTITEPIKVNPEYVDPNKIVYTDTEFENL